MGLTYAFAAPPEQVATFTREAAHLKGAGAGSVTIRDATTGCGFTATLPFSRPLPMGTCGRISLRVRPRVLRAGRRTPVRVTATAIRDDGTRGPLAGAIVRLARVHAATNARGTVVLRVRLRAGTRRVRVTAPGLLTATVPLRIRR